MTTDRRARFGRWAAFVVLALAAACAGTVTRRGGLSDEEYRKLPSDVADAYQVFAQRCSRCHTLARPLSAKIDTEAHWRLYVTRMRRQPGSGISEADAERVLIFLNYYTAERLREGTGSSTTAPSQGEGAR